MSREEVIKGVTVRRAGKSEAMKWNRYMEKRSHRGAMNLNPDRNWCFVLRRCILYLGRLFEAYPMADKETVMMLTWVLGPEMAGPAKTLLEKMGKREREKYEVSLEEDLSDPEEAPGLISRILRQSSRKVEAVFWNASSSALERRYRTLAYSGRSDAEKKVHFLKKMFRLTENETALVEFLYIISAHMTADEYFVNHLRCQELSGRRYLKTILGMTEQEMNEALSGTLARIEFYEMDKYSLSLTDDFLSFFQKPSNELPSKQYFTRFSRKTIPLESHQVEQEATEHILTLLNVKRESANHILLYGPPGTGKTTYALGLARKLGVPAYEILREEGNTTSKRRAAILACLNMTNGGDGSLIVVDEADNLLNTQCSWFFRGETQDKGWLNQLLEEPGARMIWITNNISEIEGSVLRRFAFSVHFPAFNRKQRIGLWESVLRRHRVKRCFNAEDMKKLSARYPVSVAAIDLAVRKALETSSPEKPCFKEVVKMNLNAHMALVDDSFKPSNKEMIETSYSVEGLNVEGNLSIVMKHLKEFDLCLRRSDQQTVRNFNLLFYGPPGTGKSELARHIAGNLERALMVKRASDVVSPFVGQTEQNISRVFSEAEAEEAVLVIDEADSFLFNRSRAIRSWEISHTNEFLTQMERFRGILICTTNRFEDLDQASIRRFNYKIGFRCLTPEGNIIFYRKLLCPLASTYLKREAEGLISQVSGLTPGDFRVVRDRFAILQAEGVTHDMMIRALQEESEIKQRQAGRKPIGF